jgi:surface antigen
LWPLVGVALAVCALAGLSGQPKRRQGPSRRVIGGRLGGLIGDSVSDRLSEQPRAQISSACA